MINLNGDELVGPLNQYFGHVCAKFAYLEITIFFSNDVPKWWYGKLCKWHMPLKLKCFMWLDFENCFLT